jgi:hypothetical protein
MIEKPINSWADFEDEINTLFNDAKGLKEKNKPYVISDPIFRGQSNAQWKIQTTLERTHKKMYSLKEYYLLMKKMQIYFESFSKGSWTIPDFEEPKQMFWPKIAGLDFMVYLRHHNFPSPLLDWTRSPYIAAFFAFNSIHITKDVSIYVYLANVYPVQTYWEKEPVIASIGPYIKTHARHHLQQCDYTVCLKEMSNTLFYCSYEDVFNIRNNQNILLKFNLSQTLQKEFLKKLDLMNINAYSLFASDEGLCNTLSNRELLFDK